jgi:hypothetical protein
MSLIFTSPNAQGPAGMADGAVPAGGKKASSWQEYVPRPGAWDDPVVVGDLGTSAPVRQLYIVYVHTNGCEMQWLATHGPDAGACP